VLVDRKDAFPERFGPFVLLKMLGAGGMGTAYLALHPETQQLLVVKRMHPELIRDETIFKRFVHEAEVATHVRHANVAALVAMGTIDKEPFLATEYVFGIQWSRIVDRVEESLIDPVPLGIALHLAVELVSGVQAIHEARHLQTGAPLGLIHRDVGARNVLIGFDGRVRLIDLGLGKSILSDWQTAHEVLAGSPDYMPPEQAMGATVDARADVYAAAVTIWEMLAGKKRIREESVPARLQKAIGAQPEPLLQHRPDAPERLEAILKTAMHPDPDRRTSTAALFKRTLSEETLNIARRMSRQDIITWLDAACATIIAREKRNLDEAKDSAKSALEPAQRPRTKLFVGSESLQFAPAPAPPPPELELVSSQAKVSAFGKIAAYLDPKLFKKAPLEARIAVFSMLAVVLISLAASAAILLADEPDVTAISIPLEPQPPPPRRLVKEDDVPLVAPPPYPAPPPPPEAKTVQRDSVSPEIAAKKRALIARIRELRRVNFEMEWQAKLTRLSTKLSKARTDDVLDEIDSTIAKMESEI
jgi:serine/threonine protein kinase